MRRSERAILASLVATLSTSILASGTGEWNPEDSATVSPAAVRHVASSGPGEYADIRTGHQLLPPAPLDGEAPQQVLTRLLGASGALTPAWSLSPFETRQSPLGTHHRFNYVAHGLPLLDHFAALHVDGNGLAWYATHSVRAALPAVSAGDATGLLSEARAHEFATLAASGDHLGARLGWGLHDGTVRPVWEMGVAPPIDEEHGVRDLRILLDARTGALLSLEDKALEYREGTATVFPVSPTVSAKDYDLADVPGGVDSPHLNQYLVPVTLQGLSEAPGQAGRLVGEFATVDGVARSASYDFSYTRMPDEFQEVMVYYNTDRLQRYIQGLGFDDVNNESQRTITANQYSLTPNAFYRPGDDVMVFHARSWVMANVDTAEDAEVIVHENGHAIQHDQVPGWEATLYARNYDQSSMGEGFGDFLAAAFLAEDSGGFGDPCIAEWYGSHMRGLPGTPLTGPACARNLDNEFTYGEIGLEEIHTSGQVWSGLLWNLWHSSSRDIAVTVTLASHFLLDPSSTMLDATDALILADEALYDGSHSLSIAENARRREIAGPLGLYVLGEGPVPGPETPVDPALQAVYSVEGIPPVAADLEGWDRLNLHRNQTTQTLPRPFPDQSPQLVVPPFPFFDTENITRLGIWYDGILAPGSHAGDRCAPRCRAPLIAGLQTALEPDKCGEIRYEITSSQVRVAYHEVPYFMGNPGSVQREAVHALCRSLEPVNPLRPDGVLEPPSVDFWMAIEFATGNIEIHLLRADGGAAAKSGIGKLDGLLDYQVRHTADALGEPVAWRFVRHVVPKVSPTYTMASIPARSLPVGPWENLTLVNNDAVTVPIPATKFYDRTDIDEITISSNGYVVLGGPADPNCRSGAGLPAEVDCQNGLVAALWTDLNPTHCGRVSYQTLEGWVRVSFKNVGYASGTASQGLVCDGLLGTLYPGGVFDNKRILPRFVDFWIGIELATGNMEVHLLRVEGGLVALTGIEAPDGRSGYLVRSTAEPLASRAAWRFERQASTP